MKKVRIKCMSEQKIGYKDVLKQTEYMKVILAALINRFGDSIDAIASSWIVYELTGNAAWSAIIFAVNKLPTVLITPLAGAWVEGRKKKTIMIVTDIIRAICVAIVATGYLMGFLQAWMLVITTFTISTAEAFRSPANTAMTPQVLDKEYFTYGMSLMSTVSSIVELVGTAMAAGIIAVIGTAGAIYIDMVTFLLSAFIMFFVNTKEQVADKKKFDGKEYFETLKGGFLYVKSIPLLFALVIIVLFLNAIIVPLNSLGAPMASEILGAGAESLSILSIAITIGTMLGTVIYPKIEEKIAAKILLLAVSFGVVLFYVGIPSLKPFYDNKYFMYAFLAFVSGFLGMCASFTSMFASVTLVKTVKEDYLARVASIVTAVSQAAIPVTSFIVSVLLGYFNTKEIFYASGALGVIMAIYIIFSKAFNVKNEEKEMEAEPETI